MEHGAKMTFAMTLDLSTVDFSIVNSNTGSVLMRQVYTDQGNIGIHIPAGSYTIILHNGSLLAGDTHSNVNS